MSRLLKRLRVHGLIKKVGHTYKYYLTRFGKAVMTTGLKLRELVIIPNSLPPRLSNSAFLPVLLRIQMQRY